MPFISDGQQQKIQSSSQNDLIPNLIGALGGTAGQALGTPFDLVSGPAGTMAGGALFGSAAQGGAQAVQNALTGQPLGQNVPSEAAQGGIWGAIPFGEEGRVGGLGIKELADVGLGDAAKTGIKALAKGAVKRAAIGAPAGAAVQTLRNQQQGQNWQNAVTNPNLLATGAISGAANALAPGIGKVVKGLGGFVGKSGLGEAGKAISGLTEATGKRFVGGDAKKTAGAIANQLSTGFGKVLDQSGASKPYSYIDNLFADPQFRTKAGINFSEASDAKITNQIKKYMTQTQDQAVVDWGKAQNMSSEEIGRIQTQLEKNPNTNMPMSYWRELKSQYQNYVNFTKKNAGGVLNSEAKAADYLQGQLQDMIYGDTAKAMQAQGKNVTQEGLANLNKKIGAAASISKGESQANKGFGSSWITQIQGPEYGILGALAALGIGNPSTVPAVAPAAIALMAMHNPSVASTVASLSPDIARLLQQVGIRSGALGTNSTNQQQEQ